MATFAEFTEKNKKKKKGQSFEEFTKSYLGNKSSSNDIASVTEDKKWYQDFFKKSDGNFLGAAGATLGDALLGIGKGAGRVAEGVSDAIAHGIAGAADLFGAEDTAAYWREVAGHGAIDAMAEPADDFLDDYSVLGGTSDSVMEGLGQVGAMVLLGAAGGTAATTATMGVSSFGSGMTEAYAGGATDAEAFKYGLTKGAIDSVSEMIFGGLGKAANALGYSKGLSSIDDALAKKLGNILTKNIKKESIKNIVGNTAEFIVKSGAEGLEEVIAGYLTAHAKKGTFQSEEDFKKLLQDESLLEQFVIGALTSGVVQSGIVPGMKGGSLIDTTKKGQDFVTGLNANETAVVEKVYADEVARKEESGKKLSKREKVAIYDKVVADLERGDISTDSIESILGGDDYKAYKTAADKVDSLKKERETLKKEFDSLNQMKSGEMTGEQTDRLNELRSRIKDLDQQISDPANEANVAQLKQKVSDSVSKTARGTRLETSYAEAEQRKRRYAADLSEYNEKQSYIVKKAIDSGILNNTRKSHELVDLIAKLYADKGVDFDFLTNEKLKESSYAVDGKYVNGYYDSKSGRIGLNVESKKYLNAVVGHEIAHVLEGTEAYAALQKALFDYSKKKGDFESRRKALEELYESEDVDHELTADLVGDYIFADPDFVRSLAVNNRNLFQKIFDEIKYLCKIATAGSKEARELERIKKVFEDTYREGGKTGSPTDKSVKYSLEEQKNPTYNDLVSKKPITIVNVTGGIESGSYADMKAAAQKKANDEGWYDAPHHNIDTNSLIFITENSFSHAFNNLSYTFGEDTIRAMAHIPEIIKEAVLVNVADPKEENRREKKVYTFIGAINGKNGIEPIKLTVKEFDFKSMNSVSKNIRSYFEKNGVMNTYDSLYDARALEVIGIEEIKKESNASGKGNGIYPLAQSTSDSTISISAPNVYNTWIRSVDDIKTLAETLEDSDWSDVDEFDPDLTRADIERAIESGRITVYSSYPIKNGVFVSPSKMEAQSYSADGRVYQKTVNVDDVAWIDPTQGQYAEIKSTKSSLSSEDKFPMRSDGYGITSEDVRFDEIAFEGFPTAADEKTDAVAKTNVMEDAEGTTEAEYPIYTTEQKISDKKRNYQAELDKNVQLRNQNDLYYDQKISESQTKYDALENKNTKAANDLARSIERMKRLKANRNAEFTKRINDLESQIAKADDQLSKSHYKEDQLTKYKIDSAKRLETEKQILSEEFAVRRSALESEIADKGNYVSRRAKELYNELIWLKKGVRASKELGYLLDHGYSWNALKSSLLVVSGHPNDVATGSVEESAIREMLNEEYDGKVYELDELDTEYKEKVAELENQTEEKIKAYRIANQRRAKEKEYTDLAERMVGDISTWVDKRLGLSYKVNTFRRNLRDIVRDENGNPDIEKADAIDEEYRGKYNINQAKLNKESNEIKKPFFDMKITKEESAYIQMLGEFRHNPDTTLTEDVVKGYYEKHRDKINVEKVDKAIEMARKVYDDLLERVNAVLREQGMKEIPYRKGYFPHFTEDKQGWLAKLLNWKTQNTDIPTSIAGLTEQFKPVRSYQSFNKQRTTDTTDYNFAKGFDTYVQGALDWIYHIEDIQKRRALENYIRYVHSDKGVQEKINKIRNSDELDAEEMQQQIDLVYSTASNPLNNFVTDLRAGTNRLANKKSSMDRGVEEATNRKIYSVMTNVSNRVSANMVGANFSSALSNFIPLTQMLGEVPLTKALRATSDVIRSYRNDDGVVDKSVFLTNRLRQAENLYKDNWDKIGDKLGLMFEGIDNLTSQIVWRSKYLDNMSHGMSEAESIKNADQFAANVMADRSKGNLPTIFESKNPLIKVLTAFQLEVSNQYGYMLKDLPADVGKKSKVNLVKAYFSMFIGAYVYNELASKLTGRYAAFDPVRILKDLLSDLFDDEEEKPRDNILGAIKGFGKDVAEEVPFIGGLLGGGRVPISSALPDLEEMWDALHEDEFSEGAKKFAKSLDGTFYYGVLPMGGGQIKKTVEGLSMFDDDFPTAGSYTGSGDLRFPVEDTHLNRLQAGMFGQWSSKNARDYFEEGRSPLSEKQTQELIDTEMTIQEYWEYLEGLRKFTKKADKIKYINSLDLLKWQKTILIKNLNSN